MERTYDIADTLDTAASMSGTCMVVAAVPSLEPCTVEQQLWGLR